MPQYGLKNIHAAQYNLTGGVVSYGSPVKVGDAMTAQIEPEIAEAALYAPTSGIVCPFGMTIGFAENAAMNGAEFRMNTRVENIRRTENGYLVETSRGELETRTVVNAAGVYADAIHNMVSDKKLHITARKGEYYLLRAEGDSMEDAGISEGDLVLIRRQTSCEEGDIVVALDGNGENTLKIYAGTDGSGSGAVLKYAKDVYLIENGDTVVVTPEEITIYDEQDRSGQHWQLLEDSRGCLVS